VGVIMPSRSARRRSRPSASRILIRRWSQFWAGQPKGAKMTHSENQSGLSRRQFLQGMAAIGGSAMAYQALYTLGITPPSSYKAPLRLQGQANGQRVIILGAGLAGLTAAYELNNAGYECVVLEARGRAGGRCWTVRGGDTGEEASGDQQTSTFDDGLFFNAGPDRIPQEHRAVLAYCKAFNI